MNVKKEFLEEERKKMIKNKGYIRFYHKYQHNLDKSLKIIDK